AGAPAVRRRPGPLRPVQTDGAVNEPVEHQDRLWVPGNRWDLIAARIGAGPRERTAVVVTHFEQPASLARMYAALGEVDPARFELVVTDDGSSRPPSPPP